MEALNSDSNLSGLPSLSTLEKLNKMDHKVDSFGSESSLTRSEDSSNGLDLKKKGGMKKGKK